MLSNRPYLLRAFYQWIVDSECTPVLVVDATHPRCQVPKDYIEDGEILFNVAPTAVRDFKISNALVEFRASFSGVVYVVSVPVTAVMAVYAEENNEGLFFDAENTPEIPSDSPALPDASRQDKYEGRDAPISANEKKKPFLRIVGNDKED